LAVLRDGLAELDLPDEPVVRAVPDGDDGRVPEESPPVSAFGIVMAVNTLRFVALHAYIARNLIRPELAETEALHVVRKSFVGVLSYLLGVSAAWLDVRPAFLIYMLTPVFFIVPPRGRHDEPASGTHLLARGAR
jgi:hypothetical protein